jgi:agmatine deiminase
MPGRVGPGRDGGVRLPASYANFYIANACVLVPLYSHAYDRKALTLIRKLFPDRKVVGIECTALVYGLGSIHCVTQQEPL